MGGIICQDCGGSGCPVCDDTGYFSSYYQHRSDEAESSVWADRPIVPIPYGKILPDLTDCHYPNIPEPVYLDRITCPGCGSDNVVGLSGKHNPSIAVENISPGGRWFCISCQDSWCYEREH